MTWQALWEKRHGINAGTRRALGLLLSIGLVIYFVFCVSFLSLRYFILPNIDVYKPQVEQMATKAVGRKVSIATIHASWRGLNPHLVLTNVLVHNKRGEQALSLPKVSATVSWWSMPAADLRLETLEISRPDMDIERDKDGNFYVAGVLVDRQRDDEGKGLDWILSQREIVIRDGWVRWNDAMRGVPELVLNDVDFVLHNQWRHHRFALKATPPEQLAAPIDIRADFVHPAFGGKTSDFKRWKGTLYGDWRNTDLAAWKTYFDYPVDVQQGAGSVRAWLTFDHARIVDFTADLTLSKVSARLRKDLQVLNLAQVKGRVSASEGPGKASLLSFGTHGHTVSLKGFSFETSDGLKFPETTITHVSVPATKNAPEKTRLDATALDLHTVSNFVGHLPLTATQLQMLADFAPRGHLKDFSAEWQGTYPDISAYKVKGRFESLSLNAQAPRPARPKQGKIPAQAAVPGIPGFENLTGSIDASDQGGSFKLAASDVKLNLPGYFNDPVMPFEKLDMQAKWDLKDKTKLMLQIESMNFVQEGAAGSLKGTHWMPLIAQQGTPLGTVDISAKISTLDLNRVGRYLPVGTPEDLRSWLTGALVGGQAKDVSVVIKGDVADIPFHAQKLPNKLKGRFAIAGKIEKGILNYAPDHFGKDGKAPFWPLLEEIDGRFSVDRARMQIHADSAKTFNVQIADVDALIPDLLSPDNVLEIDGKASGALQDFVGYVNNSPVAGFIDDFTEETKATGDAKLKLKLQLPLHAMKEAKVQGTVQFADNSIILQDMMPWITNANGELAFHEKGFALNGIKANFLGGSAAVSGGTQRDGTTSVRVEGAMSSDGLRRAYPTPVMQRLLQQVAGGTRYAATINVKNKRPEILVESSMQGIALNFPSPLRKAPRETRDGASRGEP
ncbi:MAG: YhdP family protein, partial [Burkholderiaceae bacterium]